MATATHIAWTDHTWNPWQGCTKVSSGCANCYMFREKNRFGQAPDVVTRSKDATFRAPLKWHLDAIEAQTEMDAHNACNAALKPDRSFPARLEPKKVFVCSWSDFFHEAADPWRAEAWKIMHACRHLIFQIPTKRIERARQCLPDNWGRGGYPNVWIGASVENQAALDRAATLARLPAAVRFLSIEPMLEAIDLTTILAIQHSTHPSGYQPMHGWPCFIHWIIFGGESGPHARPCALAWIRRGIAQCQSAGVPAFVKQLGACPIDGDGYGNPPEGRLVELHSPAGADPAEWPADLQVRHFPESRPA